MPFGNGELTDADQSVHLSRILVAEQGRGFIVAQRQIPVGAGFVQVCLILERTGHGAQGQTIRVVGVADDKHTVQIVIPVARNFIEIGFCHKGSHGRNPAPFCLFILHKPLQNSHHRGALGQQDRQALSDHIRCGEVFQFSAQLVVIPFLGLFLLL